MEESTQRLFSVDSTEGRIFYSSVCTLYHAPHIALLTKLKLSKEIFNIQSSKGKPMDLQAKACMNVVLDKNLCCTGKSSICQLFEGKGDFVFIHTETFFVSKN